MKRLFKGTGYLLLLMLVVQTVLYWQDPVYWRRYYVSFIQMGNVDMEFFKPYAVIGNDNAAPLRAASAEEKTLSLEAIDDLVDDIESQLYNSMKKEVESHIIGEMVMENLKGLDEVAYVRFASIYREFRDINTFMDELKKILEEK